jgi:SPP1 family phage portal protein
MELEVLQTLIPNYEELQKKFREEKPAVDIATFQKQYNPKDHDVKDPSKRPDKLVTTDQGDSSVPVTRIPVPLQKTIVRRAAAFLCGNPIMLSANPPDQIAIDLLAAVQKTWDDAKLDYDNKAMVKLLKKETEVAELWYTEPVDDSYWANTSMQGSKFRLRMKILANEKGDSLFPVFNAAGDMIAFGRAYMIKVADKKEEHFDTYTDTQIILGVKTDSGWQVTSSSNLIGKIPVIYYSQDAPDWQDVQDAIDRYEKSISNHGDTNDYTGSPIVVCDGEVEGFAKKGEQGKVIQVKNGAKVSYLSYDQAPESVKLEQTNIKSLIYEQTDTPDISFEQMKGIGPLSGFALKMLFMAAHMKAADGEEIFGKGIQRRINYLKAAIAKINVKLEKALPLSIKPQFEYFLPKDDSEKVDNLVTASGGKPIISRKTAVALNPLVQDPETEIRNLEEEDKQGLDTQFNT